MSTPLLATKLFPPPARPRLVDRPRLTQQLDTTLDVGHRLTLVSAPAGFGKTTLLGDWLRYVDDHHPQTHVAWLSLDDADNDLARFLSHVVAALRGAGLDLAAGHDGLETGPAVLTALIDDVLRSGETAPETRWVLVLDDYHAVYAAEVHDAVTFLLDHAPAQLHLAVATRSDPPLPLARLRSRGHLTEVRAADLRFRQAEAVDFLNRAMGLDLTGADVQTLEERTEGWIAGLQLAALSLRGIPERGEVVGFIDAFAGSDRFVIDYLADEVLARQSQEVREFLLRTAVLERLTGPLCDALTDRADGTARLVDLERDNLFLVPLDTRRTWHRYHHLFADVLRARLASERPDLVPELHRRASAWHAAHGLATDAVRHALAAEDFDRAAFLMEEALPELRRGRQDGVLLSWVRSMPDTVVRRRPVLCILSGWSSLVNGDLDGLESRLDDAERALAAGATDDALAASWADTEDLRTAPATVSVYRASLAQARGDVEATARHARRALELSGPEDHLIRGSGGGFLGLAAWAAGDVEEALTTFSEAVRSLRAAGNAVDALDSTVVLADLWIASGRPARARALFEQTLSRATAGGEPYPRATADLHVGLAELDRELDDLPSAEAHLAIARVLAERSSISENRHRWYVAQALVHSARGDLDSVWDLLDEAEGLYRHGFYPDVRPIPALRARLRIARGDLDAADEWVRAREVSTQDAAAYLHEYDHLTLVRLRLAQHRRDPAGSALDGVLDLIDRLQADAESTRAGSLIDIGVMRALTHDALGRREDALADLGRALGRAPEPEGYVRLFLDEGAPMLALLRAAAALDDSEQADLSRQARRLLVATTAEAARLPDPLADPLSRRELEVLGLLESELSGPEMARALFVSVNTLRTHTKRIFTKLDVSSRAAAVRRGHELGLL